MTRLVVDWFDVRKMAGRNAVLASGESHEHGKMSMNDPDLISNGYKHTYGHE